MSRAKNIHEAMADTVRQTWRSDSACIGSTAEFIDVGRPSGQNLVETVCRRCPVIAECRAEGDRLAPHAWPSVYGGRVYAKGEPALGWPEDVAS